ncbi:MAG: Mobile element protein [Firmicutes bacterium]|nr:Mobile element protein [Bacillota bacterium]
MSFKTKLTPEEKIHFVERYLSGTISQHEISRITGIVISSIQQWICRYKAEGSVAFFPANKQQNYSPELKEKVVKEYLSGGGSLLTLCEKYKICSPTQIRRWIKQYNRHEDYKQQGGHCHMTKARKTTQEERAKIAKECLAANRNYGEIANNYHVSYQQAYSWTNKFAQLGATGVEDRRGQRINKQEPRTDEEKLKVKIAQLEHENYLLKMERDFLKKLDALERRRD